MRESEREAARLAATLRKIFSSAGRIVPAVVSDTSPWTNLGFFWALYGGNPVSVIYREATLPQVGDIVYIRKMGGEKTSDYIFVHYGVSATGAYHL